jgi:hypothetical protein
MNKVTVYMSARKKMWSGWRADPKRWMAFMPALSNFKEAIYKETYNNSIGVCES